LVEAPLSCEAPNHEKLRKEERPESFQRALISADFAFGVSRPLPSRNLGRHP
jgi:hypothetical protein